MFEQILKDYPNVNGFMNVILSDNIEIYGEQHNEKLRNTSIVQQGSYLENTLQIGKI